MTLIEENSEIGVREALDAKGLTWAEVHADGLRVFLTGTAPSEAGRFLAISAAGGVVEIILAVNATVEGQTTAHYITDQLDGMDVKVSRLAHGVPVGGELDYLDEGTLAAAMKSRTAF